MAFVVAIVRDNRFGYVPLVMVLLLILFILVRIGYRYEWTGFGGASHPKGRVEGHPASKTLWDWLELLMVPLALAVVGLWFTVQQDARQQTVENQRAQDTALQAYLDQMSQLILHRHLLESEARDPVYILAQARTSTVILRLDAEHNASVIRFLSDSGLTKSSKASVSLLRGIALSGADLSGADLSEADLHGADLSEADLSEADLSDTDLREANLEDADLSNADLEDAKVSKKWLDYTVKEAKSLQGATMPNGQQYEDWLESKGRGEE
jgi:hypothetical protein